MIDMSTAFEDLYFELRLKEKRIYNNGELAELPDVYPGDDHYKEWKIRSASCKKLLRYLRAKQKPLSILEVGCGNGWFARQLTSLMSAQVVGIDICSVELKQAQTVFGHVANLEFRQTTLDHLLCSADRFDIIVFAASIQYFPSLDRILAKAMNLLRPKGEIHLLDTHFYTEDTLGEAKKRSCNYFSEMRFPQMSQYYFHHTLDQLAAFSWRIKYNPKLFANRLRPDYNPFYWIIIDGHATSATI